MQASTGSTEDTLHDIHMLHAHAGYVHCSGPGSSAQALCSCGYSRVCIVNNHGAVLMDKFARPKERVTDFRTRYSGIRCFLLPAARSS